MASSKVTVTLPDDQIAAIRALVARDAAPNISAFVQRSVAVALDDAEQWAALLSEALAETGGPLTPAEAVWADDVVARRLAATVVTSDPGDVARLDPSLPLAAI